MHVLGALLHLVLGPSKLDDVALVRWIREVDDNLQGVIIDSKLKQTQELLCQTHAKIREILYILCPIQKRDVSKPLVKTSIFLFVLESCYIYDFSNKTSTQVGNIPSGLLISL